MSTDYDADIAVGYIINLSAIPKKLIKKLPEITHMEDRYDEKTGRKLPDQVEVVDSEERSVYIFDRSEYDEDNEFLDALAAKVGGEHGYNGNFASDDLVHWIGPKIPKSERNCEEAGYGLEWLATKTENIRAIGAKLRKLGFKVGKPRVVPILSVS
jgi:hypothetical protein